jgi:2-keto-4-pentenoate hydratase
LKIPGRFTFHAFMNKRITVLALGLVLVSCLLQGAPLPDTAIGQLVSDYLAIKPSQWSGQSLTLDEALRAQSAFVKQLEPKLGKPVGYKVGLVTREMQERFRATAPVRGVLLSDMLLNDGAEVPANFGVRPICEADLIVVVKDKRINRARSPLQAARSLKEIIAFIELPDAFLSTNQPIDSSILTAINVGARLGVLGERLPVKANEDFVKMLEFMTVTMTDQSGQELGRVQGRVILDQPLNALLWLAEELARAGGQLKPGDLISLGSLQNITPKAGQTITVHYRGLPGGPIKASVKFK